MLAAALLWCLENACACRCSSENLSGSKAAEREERRTLLGRGWVEEGDIRGTPWLPRA